MPEPYASLLRLLEDCHEVPEVAGPVYRQQHVGAIYRSLAAAIGHRVEMDEKARVQWYRIADSIPLSHVDAYESARETSGILLDIYPVGPILSLGRAKTCLSWDRVVFIELVEG